MTDQKMDTKERIMCTAMELFSKNGFQGTSVRDIAKNADVNIAAVNYHFENKENLYWEICMRSTLWMQEGVEKLYTDEISTEDFSLRVFQFMIENGVFITNIFKLMLTDLDVPDGQLKIDPKRGADPRQGPPGGLLFYKVITREVGEDVPDKLRRWAVKAIFSHMAHMALIVNTPYCKEIQKVNPDLSEEELELGLKRLVQSVLQFIDSQGSAAQ